MDCVLKSLTVYREKFTCMPKCLHRRNDIKGEPWRIRWTKHGRRGEDNITQCGGSPEPISREKQGQSVRENSSPGHWMPWHRGLGAAFTKWSKQGHRPLRLRFGDDLVTAWGAPADCDAYMNVFLTMGTWRHRVFSWGGTALRLAV